MVSNTLLLCKFIVLTFIIQERILLFHPDPTLLDYETRECSRLLRSSLPAKMLMRVEEGNENRNYKRNLSRAL